MNVEELIYFSTATSPDLFVISAYSGTRSQAYFALAPPDDKTFEDGDDEMATPDQGPTSETRVSSVTNGHQTAAAAAASAASGALATHLFQQQQEA
ncbi:hypothetical protein AXG93_392s1110 [Marchantia polymorpha subsp. ruderalis]|uniref:Uncharacterized protein n=1 Tax=Marchantia polymorpha subsp. ruderalis TaxID=1480154 RepID=A0A176WR07_MARPO|nr:hypothetical protein AXG93_392s1110 [Marchantia polymorpha subsp. ruderalis]